MNQILTNTEIEKIQNMCFKNPVKACAVAQLIIDTCQVVSCKTFADVNGKGKRIVNYQSQKLTGVKIEHRKFISVNQ